MSYNYHEAAVNAVCFYEHGRKFVSTSDDRKMLCWDYGYNPPNALHPRDLHVVDAGAQAASFRRLHSLQRAEQPDRRVQVHGHRGPPPRKRFNGHKVGGFALQPTCSPDGEFVGCRRLRGQLWFWSWKTCKVLNKTPGHVGAVACLDWHPVESSYVASSGWDGVIKLWDWIVCLDTVRSS